MKEGSKSKIKFGLLAHPAKGSLSPVIFNAAFKRFGINARYNLYDIEPTKLRKFIHDVKASSGCAEKIYGLSVSAPHKISVMKFLDSISPEAKKIGAVNTISNIDGKLYGFNTDCYGAIMALKECSSLTELVTKKIIVVGAGGASRSVLYGLIENGASRKNITVINRTFSHTKSVGSEFGVSYLKTSDMSDIKFDILINTSSVFPVDLRENKFLVNNKRAIVMDIVYKPSLMTPLLRAAKKVGCKTITGENMLLWQAVGQFKTWFEE